MGRLPFKTDGGGLLLELEVNESKGIAAATQQVQRRRCLPLHASGTDPQVYQCGLAFGIGVIAPIAVTGREVCDVLFKGEVWRADTIQLRVVSDG